MLTLPEIFNRIYLYFIFLITSYTHLLHFYGRIVLPGSLRIVFCPERSR
ncbi:unnamed protein product [Oikopleura dioica]|uniref:Uncharacterized protein n=1 Tax=Oikopleura dioica TaxID=34765 RepID=E4WZH0_OIKDI|nr:unnamed protein product [Oikopleura dioica]